MTVFLSILILAVTIIAFFCIFVGAPYLPSKIENIKKIIDLSKAKPGEKIVDLGSGDGRIVIAFARKGIEAHGYEINPVLVWLSRKNIKKDGLEKKAFIHTKNFWINNFSKFDVVSEATVGN